MALAGAGRRLQHRWMDHDRFAVILESPLDDPDSEPGRRSHFRWAALVVFLAAVGIAVGLILTGGEDGSGPAAGEEGAAATVAGVPGTPAARLLPRLVTTPGGVLMFGGMEPAQDLDGTRLGDVWRYDSAADQWYDLETPAGPAPRVGEALAYDSQSGVVVLFGGALGSCEYPFCPERAADTWVYDPAANTWEERSPGNAPSPRFGHAMAYDPGTDRIVLFGGDDGTAWVDDIWAYDADSDSWALVGGDDEIWGRAGHVMAYAPEAGGILVWGGYERDDEAIWVLDPASTGWERVAPGTFPAPAWEACLVWDEGIGRAVLIGGEGYTTEEISEGVTTTGIRWRDEVWAFDGEARTWTMLSELPEPLAYHGCAADPGTGAVVVWAGDRAAILDPATGAVR